MLSSSQILAAVGPWSVFSKEEAACFVSLFEERKFKKNEVLLQAGDISHEVFFVLKGALRQYFITEDGAERTCNIVFENEFLTDLESFSSQAPGATNIVALEPVTCLVAGCKDVGTAIRAFPGISHFFRSLVERVAEGEIRRTKSMLSLTPDKRFEELVLSRPGILQRVSQRYIAQYLGIAPESLSRIRKRMMYVGKS